MHEFYHHWHSSHLGQQFEVKQFGDRGPPMLAFPSSEGRFFDYANQGMIGACADFIESGQIQVFCVDGRDWETWANVHIPGHDRAVRHNQWEAAVVEEVIPLIRKHAPEGRNLIVTGCSGGAYHAANFMFKHPHLCKTAILLSGVYSTKHFRTDHVDDYDYGDQAVYFNNPLKYLPGWEDQAILKLLRDSEIIICCGQGAYEHECLAESRALSAILEGKGIRHWLDIWGHDVNHDWPWWRNQIVYFLNHVLRKPK